MPSSYRSWHSTTPSLVHATRVGLLHPRTGGLPLRLRYFLPPADLVSGGKALAPTDLTEAVLLQRDLGLTVTLTLERCESRACLMPTKSLVTNLDTSGVPVLGDEMVAGKGNCVSLPARFLLRLNAPLVVSLDKCREIEKMTGFQFAEEALKEESAIGASTPLMQAIVKNKSGGLLDGANNRGLFVVRIAFKFGGLVSELTSPTFRLCQTSNIATFSPTSRGRLGFASPPSRSLTPETSRSSSTYCDSRPTSTPSSSPA